MAAPLEDAKCQFLPHVVLPCFHTPLDEHISVCSGVPSEKSRPSGHLTLTLLPSSSTVTRARLSPGMGSP